MKQFAALRRRNKSYRKCILKYAVTLTPSISGVAWQLMFLKESLRTARFGLLSFD
jgi:hypothetical protein